MTGTCGEQHLAAAAAETQQQGQSNIAVLLQHVTQAKALSRVLNIYEVDCGL
jgi:hypothetical protein